MKNVIIEMDGNSFYAYREGFINLQESTAGFGLTELEALEDLIKQENKNVLLVEQFQGTKKRFSLGKNILLSVGTTMEEAPVNITLIAPHYEIIIGIGNDHHAKFLISEEAAKALFGVKQNAVIF